MGEEVIKNQILMSVDLLVRAILKITAQSVHPAVPENQAKMDCPVQEEHPVPEDYLEMPRLSRLILIRTVEYVLMDQEAQEDRQATVESREWTGCQDQQDVEEKMDGLAILETLEYPVSRANLAKQDTWVSQEKTELKVKKELLDQRAKVARLDNKAQKDFLDQMGKGEMTVLLVQVAHLAKSDLLEAKANPVFKGRLENPERMHPIVHALIEVLVLINHLLDTKNLLQLKDMLQLLLKVIPQLLIVSLRQVMSQQLSINRPTEDSYKNFLNN